MLLANLRHTGFSDESVLWFINYIHGPLPKKIEINSLNYSTSREMIVGVPQSSILCLLRYFVYSLDVTET